VSGVSPAAGQKKTAGQIEKETFPQGPLLTSAGSEMAWSLSFKFVFLVIGIYL